MRRFGYLNAMGKPIWASYDLTNYSKHTRYGL